MFTELSDFPGYFINESGVIIDSDGIDQRISVNNSGKMYVTLNNKNYFIDELVAKTFIPNFNNFQFIKHIDHDILNNHFSNLKWSNQVEENLTIENRENRSYSNSKYIYQVFNEDESIVIDCCGRGEVASLIQYEEISLKNMVGNNRKITQGPYKGFMIRRLH